VVDAHDAAHELRLGEVDEVEDAAAQEGVRQLLLVVAGDDHDGALLGDDLLVRLWMRKRMRSSSWSRSFGNSRSALSTSSMSSTRLSLSEANAARAARA
jgi:hypothetical protein